MATKRDTVVLHHSASPRIKTTPQDIADWHEARGFKGTGYPLVPIGYTWLVDADGNRIQGRPPNKIGAHCLGFNSLSFGVCVIGHFDIEKPTGKQIDELILLLRDIKYYHNVIRLIGHCDAPHAATACPGKNLYALLPELRKETGLVK